ncbi:hypothetical protein VC83_07180 [Pseudogymnoascus destructans]|uniref:DASH complex subunit SPC34 n=2 Tax=Pseudogymnoascus destructans TaxID=655981 RepID=L8FMR8_PSED2|nr:uncharacterized protein VC83_07180 [Pseudogymnoascus destructans]ELR02245.1 hypothetical protein GMDG_05318 [Pseudogymnoascus destructans 20631-21]OAF56527.2 hypothetical protein VC83_07180 [Pseudogymnoascus destructans]
MSFLSNHLEQISLSAQSIASLPFPPPKIFTNALLASHDITALIRDTEPHERALFSVPPPPPRDSSIYPDPAATASRRRTVFNVAGGEVVSSAATTSRAPRRNAAVAAVLGADLNSEIRKSENVHKGDLDVEVLLRGAEKLGEVYVMEGARERIAQLRSRYARIQTSLQHYEQKVVKQTRELERMNRQGDWDGDSPDEDVAGEEDGDADDAVITDELLRLEEEEILELERKKKELEERVSGMERDLGGLLR